MIEAGRRAEGSRHDPGPGQPLRGLHGLGQRADRERRHRDPLRPRRGRPRTGADRKSAGGDRPARQLLGAAPPSLSTSDEDSARLGFEARRIGLHDQLHLRLRQRPGRSAGHRQGDGLRPLPAGRREQAEQTAARRLQPRGQLLLREQGRRLRSGRLPGRRQEPADRGRTRRPAALALRPLHGQSRDQGLPRLRRAGQGIDRGGRAAADHARLPGRLARRSSAPCTRRTRSTPKTPNRSTTN